MFKAICFDLFDTLVLFDRTRLPQIQINGAMVHTTAGHLFPLLGDAAPHVDLPAFFEALHWSWQQAETMRAEHDREVTAAERFNLLFYRLHLEPAQVPFGLLDQLLDTHKHYISVAASFPDPHRELLNRLTERFRLAVVSNFDYSPTVRLILDRESITDCFETVVVSDEVGWRKPSPLIFQETLRRLALAPSDVLFVGDRPEIDVLGAKRVGMAAAWINPAEEKLPQGIPAPDFEIRSLTDLEFLLKTRS
jgi:HAD superfamily hydrolase (TIGR01549 family)